MSGLIGHQLVVVAGNSVGLLLTGRSLGVFATTGARRGTDQGDGNRTQDQTTLHALAHTHLMSAFVLSG